MGDAGTVTRRRVSLAGSECRAGALHSRLGLLQTEHPRQLQIRTADVDVRLVRADAKTPHVEVVDVLAVHLAELAAGVTLRRGQQILVDRADGPARGRGGRLPWRPPVMAVSWLVDGLSVRAPGGGRLAHR